ncbi:MAG: Holliday junction resolvase RuvX [Candidatus Portnoybacteria bacterium CG23_combo_of_CG06-09_8_20_14_all_37_13]|uniref:Putative pre-16S rRNA nuclease n=1 Tax=Candidatus Portnoybacteria bacterium CG23_combo_of_CG06-09_8_20_14_all_37_13 TaxID=1974819 RepID=A0A2G9YCQ9_9BACT|nr:MAG: Holliday junction resolvase RuvX [Candidatus Portnoybacteria bacterium CG23_combo_of_CG06-09_8_20_14_all_37_13]
MKYLGIDYGEKHIGLAIGNDALKIATPFGIVHHNVGAGHVLPKIQKIIQEQKIDKIIIGLPKGFRGETEQTRKTRDFAKNFDNFEFADERFTSKIAQNHASAATIILQDYLDMLR